MIGWLIVQTSVASIITYSWHLNWHKNLLMKNFFYFSWKFIMQCVIHFSFRTQLIKSWKMKLPNLFIQRDIIALLTILHCLSMPCGLVTFRYPSKKERISKLGCYFQGNEDVLRIWQDWATFKKLNKDFQLLFPQANHYLNIDL